MFIHQSRLEHVLRPAAYFDPRCHAQEVERLFLPAWHLVATKAELARPGSYCTSELLGRPLLVRNIDGELHAFLNVCAHRHARITGKPSDCDSRFRCQYHGWEYTKDGRTARIPEANCFRPFDRENARLEKFRLGLAGDLVFVSLSPQGVSLAEYLGDFYPVCEQAFASPYAFATRWHYDVPCNWKIPIENTLEAYHIPCLHAKTFKKHATEEESEHCLEATWTSLSSPVPPGPARAFLNFMVRALGQIPEGRYRHHHVHPHQAFIRMDMLRAVLTAVPRSPGSCRFEIVLYTLRGKSPGPLRWMAGRLLRRLSMIAVRMVIEEDLAVFAEVQRGMEASPYPGALGTLEERVYVFQQWVHDQCEGAL